MSNLNHSLTEDEFINFIKDTLDLSLKIDEKVFGSGITSLELVKLQTELVDKRRLYYDFEILRSDPTFRDLCSSIKILME